MPVAGTNKERDALIMRLYAEGLNGQQIADVIGVSRGCVWSYLARHGISGKQYGYLKGITPWQEAVLIGTVLGDGCLKRAKSHHNAQLKFGHGPKQLQYMMWKKEQLTDFFSAAVQPYHFRTKDGYDTYEIASRSHPILTSYYELFYPAGKKRISAEILARVENHDFFPAIMAVWYMDDGCGGNDTGRLTIGGLDEDQYQLIAAWFQNLGFDGTMYGNNQGTNCRVYGMRRAHARRFFDLIRPYVHEDMQYKVPVAD